MHDQSTENTLNTTFNSHDPAEDNSNCAITLNPTINLRKAQQDDPSISKVIQMKTSRTPKHKLAAWRHDRNLVTFWHHYDILFVRDGLLCRSLKT
jgi:hypothetical protein